MKNDFPFVRIYFQVCLYNIPILPGSQGSWCGRQGRPGISSGEKATCILVNGHATISAPLPPSTFTHKVLTWGKENVKYSVSGEETSKKGSMLSWGWEDTDGKSQGLSAPVLFSGIQVQSLPHLPCQLPPECTAQEPPQSQAQICWWPSFSLEYFLRFLLLMRLMI